MPLLVLFAGSPVFSQSTVYVKDAKDNSPIEGVVISLAGNSAITDSNGKAVIDTNATHEALVSHVSYLTTRADVGKDGQVVYLQSLDRLLQEVQVTGFDFERELEEQ